MKQPAFDSITLPNGLRIVGEKLTHVRSCTVGVWVKVGSAQEEEAENGLSHFIEHLVFKGTQNRSAREIATEMDSVGGQLNAFTAKECTCYYAKVIDEDLPLAVDILSDLVIRPIFDDAELQKERGVVLEEIAMMEDTPDDLVHELLADVQYTGSLHRPILGTNEILLRHDRNAVVRYWQKHYTPQNMVLAIAGNYNWDEFVALATQYFSGYANTTVLATPYPPQGFRAGRIAKIKDTEQLHVCMGFEGVPAFCNDQYTMTILNTALGGGMSSRLFQRIREDLGMAYSIYSYVSGYQSLGALTVYAGTTPANGDTVMSEISTELARFAKEGIQEEEFLSAKAQIRSGYMLGLENSSGRMQSLGRGLLLYNLLLTPDEVIAKIDAVTFADMLAMAERTLSKKPSVSLVGNQADAYLSRWEALHG